MANPELNQDVFRFINVKAPKSNQEKSPIYIEIGKDTPKTPTYELLEKNNLQQLKQVENTDSNWSNKLHTLQQWLLQNENVSISQATKLGVFKDIVLDVATQASDALLYEVTTGLAKEHALELTTIIKLHALVAGKMQFTNEINEYSIGTFLAKSILLFPDFVKAPQKTLNVPKNSSYNSHKNARVELALRDLQVAFDEIDKLLRNNKYRKIQPVKLNQVKTKTISSKKDVVDDDVYIASTNAYEEMNYVVDKKHVQQLSIQTKSVLLSLDVDTDNLNPNQVLPLLETAIHEKSRELNLQNIGAYERIALSDNTFISKTYALTTEGVEQGVFGFTIGSCRYETYVGDLLIVRQKLKAYELTEIAHVENILKGELKERVHRRLDLREETIGNYLEKETEKERNQQTTERNEMQAETEKVMSEEFRFDAGLRVSGSYGPTVQFAATANASYGTSTQETQRLVTNYARELTEKVSEKIKEKVREERVLRIKQEIEETNTHKIDNTSQDKHIRGVYRWLNKVYNTQVFNYGKRMMYDFLVPEPAAFYIYAKINNPNPNDSITKPEAPRFEGRALKASDINITNYQQYVAQYQVGNVPVPPSTYCTKSFIEKQEGDTTSNYSRASIINIPDGYHAYGAKVYYGLVINERNEGYIFDIIVDGQHTTSSQSGGVRTENRGGYITLSNNYEKELSVQVIGFKIRSFTVGVDVFCRVNPKTIQKWQQEVYDAIINAYQNQLATYEDKMRVREMQRNNPVTGKNPLFNSAIERDELKKLCVMILQNNPNINFDGYNDAADAEPTLDTGGICLQASIIRFLENAFEWKNMMYVYYPYFWGRHNKWINALHFNDEDPNFEAFLKAGAARVQVPVRPGFERAVAYFAEHGVPWLGADVPMPANSIYRPIIEEVLESVGVIEEGIPYPANAQPWEITLPTSLIVLQDIDEVPNIKDEMTGSVIDLSGER